MQIRIGSKVGLLLGNNKKAATIEAFNGFAVSLLLDEDGTRISSVDLSRLLPTDHDDAHDESLNTSFDFDAALGHDANKHFMDFVRNEEHRTTVETNLRVWYKSIAAVKQNTYVRFRLMTEAKIYDDNFPSNTLTDNWKYLAGTTGWSVSSSNLVNTGGNLGYAIVPKYGAHYWFSHGVQFTLVSGSSFQLAAGIEGGVMLLDFLSGTSATLSFVPTGGPPTIIQTVTFATTVGAVDVITMFSFEKLIQIRKNNNVIAQFTLPVPGVVSTAWGFGDKYALTISNFHIVGKAQGTRWFLPIHYTVHPVTATRNRFESNEQNRVGLLDSNLSHFALQQIKVRYAYTPQPRVLMPIAYKMLGHTVQNVNVRYATKLSITQTAAISFKVKKAVAATVAAVYKVKVAVKVSALLLYKLKQPVTSQQPVAYHLTARITPVLLPVIYGLKGSPGQVAVVSYAVRGLVGKSLTEITNRMGVATQTLTALTSSRQLAAASLTEKSGVAGPVAQTLTELANSFQLAGASLTQKANSRQLAGANLTEKANAAQAIAKMLTEQSGVLTNAAQTLTEKAALAGLVADTLTEVANVMGITAKTLTEQANARQAIGKNTTQKANINADLARTFTEVANVLTTLAQTLTEKANVALTVIKSVAVNYQAKHNYVQDPWFIGTVTSGVAAFWNQDVANAGTVSFAVQTQALAPGGKQQHCAISDDGATSNAYLGVFQNGIDVHGQSVKVRVRGRTHSSFATLNFQAVYDSGGANIYNSQPAVTVDSDFDMTFSFNVPTDCTNMRIYVDGYSRTLPSVGSYINLYAVDLYLA